MAVLLLDWMMAHWLVGFAWPTVAYVVACSVARRIAPARREAVAMAGAIGTGCLSSVAFVSFYGWTGESWKGLAVSLGWAGLIGYALWADAD